MPGRKARISGVPQYVPGGVAPCGWHWQVQRPVFGFAGDVEYRQFGTWRGALDWLASTYRGASGSMQVERTTRPVADRCWDGWQMEIR